MANDLTAIGEPTYVPFSIATMDKAYDIRALVEAARCRLDKYEHCDRGELVDVDRLLCIAVGELNALVRRIDEKAYADTPNNRALKGVARRSVPTNL